MSGRHRQAQTTAVRRALLGTVPVLGLASAASVLTLTEAGTAPVAEGAGVDQPVTTSAAATPIAMERMPAAGPEATAAVSGASAAVDRAAGDQRAQERGYLTSVVGDVQADARTRDADAARKGKERLDAFQQEQENRQQAEQGTAQPAPDSGDIGTMDTGDGDTENGDTGNQTCDLSGLPVLGSPTDPDEIVGRDCGLLDPLGKERSGDPWIDGQLLSGGESN